MSHAQVLQEKLPKLRSRAVRPHSSCVSIQSTPGHIPVPFPSPISHMQCIKMHQVDVAAVDLAANRLARPAPTGTPAPPDTATPELPHVTTSLMTNLIVLTCTDQVLTVLKHGMSRNAKKIQEISRKSVAQGSDSDN